MKQSNREPEDVPHPEDFPLGSPESRAAARLLLRQWDDSRKWLTLGCNDPRPGQDPFRINFESWKELPNGNLMRIVYVPSAWRILPTHEASVPGNHVPSCPECGAPFAEQGRYGILVRFAASCLNQHDPSPPPKKTRPETTSESALSKADIKGAQECLVKICAYELQEVLAERLDMPQGHLREFISGRREADAGLRTRIAAELETGILGVVH